MFNSKNFVRCFALATITSCGSPTPQNLSHARHTWGEVARGNAPQLKPKCTVDRTQAAKRINLIAQNIASKNPETFQGSLDISNFCIGVNRGGTQKSAKTVPSQKTITFELPLLAAAQSDSQLASTVAHELAHITLQHSGMGEISPRVIATEKGRQIAAQQKQLQNKIKELVAAGAPASQIMEISVAFGKTVEAINALTDEVYGETNAHLNWAEQEADEVGAEFYIRAGYPIHEFANMLWLSSKLEPQEIINCNKLISDAWDNSTARPERGNGTHPTTCWRAFHLLVDEYGPHGAHRARLAQ